MRQQLWRYYPQFLDAVGDDVAAPWALELWRRLPTPRAGQRVREVTLTRVLKEHRIRRTDAPTLRTKLRAPAVKVAPGAVEAAVTHVELVAERLVLVNRQLDRARRALDGLVEQLAETASADDPDASAAGEPASSKQPSDVAILLSVPGIGLRVVATLLAEGGDAVRRRDYDALRCLCGVAPVTKRSGKSLIVTRRLAGRRPPAKRRLPLGSHCGRNAIQRATTSIRRYVPAATDTHAPCARWPIACSASSARCCATAPVSTRTVWGRRLPEPCGAGAFLPLSLSVCWTGCPRQRSGTHALGFFVLNEGQPFGWPSRAFRTVGRGRHPKDRSEAEDPRSGLTVVTDRAWVNAKRARRGPAQQVDGRGQACARDALQGPCQLEGYSTPLRNGPHDRRLGARTFTTSSDGRLGATADREHGRSPEGPARIGGARAAG